MSHIMEEFKIYAKDKPGELARVTDALDKHAVNIKAIASEGTHQDSFVRIVTSDVKTTIKALDAARLRYEREDIIVLSLIDRPGELAKVARKLGRNAINIESVYILGQRDGQTEVALKLDDIDKAKKLLTRQL